MDKQEYAQRRKDLANQIKELSTLASELEYEYLCQQPVRAGDKVEVTHGRDEPYETVIAYVRSVIAHSDGEYGYAFSKVKADGSKSSHRLDTWNMDKIQSVKILQAASNPPQQ